MKDGKDLSNIAFALSKGKFDGKSSRKVEVASFIVLASILGGMTIFGIVHLTLDYLQKPEQRPLWKLIFSGIGFFVMFFLIMLALFIQLRWNERLRKNVLLWLEDAVELDAYARKLGVKYFWFIPQIKLQVEFTFNEQEYVRISGDKVTKKSIFKNYEYEGYFNFVSKYVDKQVKILYSPKYDQVMVLKS